MSRAARCESQRKRKRGGDEGVADHMNTQKQKAIPEREPTREPTNAARTIGMKFSGL